MDLELEKILNKKVSYQEAAYLPISKEISIKEILAEIKSEKYSFQIKQLRGFLEKGEPEKYSIYKKNIPGVTFSALFSGKRRKSDLKEYNKIIVIDIDKLTSVELIRVKDVLLNDEYVFAFWESPSKLGLKGIVSIKYDYSFEGDLDLAHKVAFRKLSDYFKDKYSINLDESGSDTTRLCFISFDNDLIIKDKVSCIELTKSEIEPLLSKITTKDEVKISVAAPNSNHIFFNSENKNKPADRRLIQSIIRFLQKRQISITNSYEDWFRVAYGIANTFTYEIGEKYFLYLCRLDFTKHDEVKSKNMLLYCYENNNGSIKLNTIIHFANQKGYYSKNQRGRSTEGV